MKKELEIKKKTIHTLLSIIFILMGIAGGLIYADHIGYRYVHKSKAEEQIPENISISYGDYGTYKAIYDTQENKWTVGIWEDTLISAGAKNISDLQKEGGVIIFEMPWNGHINSNAGEIYVNGKLWNNGNPAVSNKGDSNISKGDEIEIRYGKDNQSAGFQVWFE